jgi:glycosyltransferase involved in cell wall biosynthesis
MPHPRPAISIITPTYNRRTALARAIRSVQRQSLTDYEHIIVDDGSNDDTEQFVREIGDERIRYHRFTEWRGANCARNAGIEMARAQWLTFLDSDDEYLPHRLAAIERAISSSASDLLLSSFTTMKRGRERTAVNPDALLAATELEELLVMHGVFIAGSSITVRKRTLDRVGGFDPALMRMQDRDVLLRLSRHCGARLLAGVDWVKHPSADSISGNRQGYVAALGNLFAAHPRLSEHYRAALGYHVARSVLSDVIGLRFRQALNSLAENKASAVLQFSWLELAKSYFAGSTRRRALAKTLRDRHDPDCVILSLEKYRQEHPAQAASRRRAA